MNEDIASELCGGSRIMARASKAPMCMPCLQNVWKSADRDLLFDVVMFHQNAPKSKECSYKTILE